MLTAARTNNQNFHNCSPWYVFAALRSITWSLMPSVTSSVTPLMTKVTHASEDHGHIVLVCRADHFGVTHRAAWLDNTANAIAGGIINAITEGEEGIGCHHRAAHSKASMFGFNRRNAGRVNAAHLPSTNTYSLAVLGVNDGIGLNKL